MVIMSVADILRKHGKWAQSKELVGMVMKKLNMSSRQAYREIRRDWKDGEIRRVVLPDLGVVYGLREWPFLPKSSKKPKEIVSFKEAFLYRWFNKLDRIRSDNLIASSLSAYRELRSLIWTLSSPVKDKLRPMIKKTDEALRNCKDEWVEEGTRLVDLGRGETKIFPIKKLVVNAKKERERIAFHAVEKLVDEVSSLLHEQLEKETA